MNLPKINHSVGMASRVLAFSSESRRYYQQSKYLKISLFQCPARWTTLQAVVSPGESPLPAEIRLKADVEDGDKFFGVYASQWWQPLEVHVPCYRNEMQA